MSLLMLRVFSHRARRRFRKGRRPLCLGGSASGTFILEAAIDDRPACPQATGVPLGIRNGQRIAGSSHQWRYHAGCDLRRRCDRPPAPPISSVAAASTSPSWNAPKWPQQHPVRLAASWLSTGASEPHSMRWRDEAFCFMPSCPTWLRAIGVTAACPPIAGQLQSR